MTRATTSPLRLWALRVAAVAGPAAMALAASWAAFDTHRATSWHFFRDAARLVFAGAPAHGGGLDVFLSHPEFQFGPLSIVAGAPFALAPQSLAVPAVIALGTLLGVVVALSVEAAATPGRPAPGGALAPVAPLAGAVALAVVWADVGVRTAHIDDAIALAATALACAGVARGRGATATAALAVAAAAKPWALAFAPLAAAAPGRRRWLRPVVALAAAGATWLPFVLDEPGSVVAAGSFRLENAPASALRALGVHDPATPLWVRPTQFAVGLAVAGVLVRRGRWPGVVMAALAVRVALDPAAHHYYSAALVAGTLLWERITLPRRLPLATIAVAVVMELTAGDLHPSALAGALRLALAAGLLLAALAVPGPGGPAYAGTTSTPGGSGSNAPVMPAAGTTGTTIGSGATGADDPARARSRPSASSREYGSWVPWVRKPSMSASFARASSTRGSEPGMYAPIAIRSSARACAASRLRSRPPASRCSGASSLRGEARHGPEHVDRRIVVAVRQLAATARCGRRGSSGRRRRSARSCRRRPPARCRGR